MAISRFRHGQRTVGRRQAHPVHRFLSGFQSLRDRVSKSQGFNRPAWKLAFAAACAGLALLASPSQAGWIEDLPDRTVIHVKLFELPDPSRREASIRADAAAVAEFRRQFPDIFAARYRERYQAHPEIYGRHNWDRVEIELHPYSGIKIGNLGSTVGMGNLLAVAGKVAPDVMYVNFRQSGTYVQEGFLYPLDQPEDGYLSSMPPDEQAFRIHPKIRPVIQRKGPDGAEHVWALPYGGALGKVVLFRKDLFDAAGIPYPDNNWTWKDFHDICRRLSDPGRGVYGVWLSQSIHEAAYWLTFLWSAGGDVLNYDPFTDSWRAVYATPEAAIALDFYTRLCTEPWTDRQGRPRQGYAWRDSANAGAKWNLGQIAMRFDYIDEKLFSEINPDVTGMVPVPIGPTGARGAELNSRMMGLFAGTEDPAVRDAAWEYMRFYDSEAAVRIKTRILVEGGLGRFVNPRLLQLCGYDEVIRLSPPGWADCFRIAVETGRPEPYARNCSAIYDIMTQPIREARELALAGRLPGEEARRRGLLQEILAVSAAKANETMLGLVPPSELALRRGVAALALAGIIAAFFGLFRRIARAFTPPSSGVGQPPRWAFRRYTWAYLLLLPAALTILVWQYLPLARGSVMAFQDYKVMGHSTWVWLDNLGAVLWSGPWWMSIWHSLRYSFLVIFLTFLPPVILAILLQEIPAGRLLFRTLYYLPAVITSLVTILLWKSFYDPTEHGALNVVVMSIPAIAYLAAGATLLAVALVFARRLLQHGRRGGALFMAAVGALAGSACFGVARPILAQPGVTLWQSLFLTLSRPQAWLSDSDTAMFCCVLPIVWAGIGPGCLIYLAALKTIPEDLYEVADIDGATFIDKILFIVFPMLRPLLVINFVGVFIASWQAAANILAMTGGDANTEVAGLHIFYQAFVHLRFGPATAMAWVLGFILIGFTVHQLRILSRLEFRSAGTEEK